MFRKTHPLIVSRLGRLEKVDEPGARRLPQHPNISQNRLRLISQLRRAAVSSPSNIAEGQARLATGEFRQFRGNARGSLMEVETQVLLARELGYFEHDESESLLAAEAEVGSILNGLPNPLPNRK